MLNLSRHVKLSKIVDAPNGNVAELLDEDDLKLIGSWVMEGYNTDEQSRVEWVETYTTAMDLAMQIKEQKDIPFENCSNIKFPLLTIAALAFHSRAYPALVNSPDIVRFNYHGPAQEDPVAKATRLALKERIEKHMSWQILEEQDEWEAGQDQLLITLPLVGCVFKETYRDVHAGINRSEVVMPGDFVVNYKATSIESAYRVTRLKYMQGNELWSRIVKGTYLKSEMPQNNIEAKANGLQQEQDNTSGTRPVTADDAYPYTVLKQNTYLDLDGDGYEEPYVIEVLKSTGQVLRIETRFNWKEIESTAAAIKGGITKEELDEDGIYHIPAINRYTRYMFISSPDGGFYGMGFGRLMGPMNESVNTILNQLVDAGTIANTMGGFVSRYARLRKGTVRVGAFEWVETDARPQDLQSAFLPVPVRTPDAVLFQLLSVLIEYGEKIGGAVDVVNGVLPGQNTPAETSRNALENGLKIYSAIYKRVYRAQKEEFRRLYYLNCIFPDPQWAVFGIQDGDYNPDNTRLISPSADPHVVSDAQRMQQALTMVDAASGYFGYNKDEVHRRLLKALKVQDIDMVLPRPGSDGAPQPPVDPRVQVRQIDTQFKEKELQTKQAESLFSLMMEAKKTDAEILKIYAEIADLQASQDSTQMGHKIAQLEMAMGMAKLERETQSKALDALLKIMQMGVDTYDSKQRGMGSAMANPSGENAAGVPGVSNQG